jgi:hypothetical protein
VFAVFVQRVPAAEADVRSWHLKLPCAFCTCRFSWCALAKLALHPGRRAEVHLLRVPLAGSAAPRYFFDRQRFAGGP